MPGTRVARVLMFVVAVVVIIGLVMSSVLSPIAL